MKRFFVIFAAFFALLALTSAMVQHSSEVSEGEFQPLLSRVARESCDNRECHQRCRSLFFKGGVCVRNKCSCDIF